MAGSNTRSIIRWDESPARQIRADVVTVAGSREEVYLLFGSEQAGHPDGQAETIRLTDRIILSLFTAKQLAAALAGFMRDYESRFGVLKMANPRSTRADRKEKATMA